MHKMTATARSPDVFPTQRNRRMNRCSPTVDLTTAPVASLLQRMTHHLLRNVLPTLLLLFALGWLALSAARQIDVDRHPTGNTADAVH